MAAGTERKKPKTPISIIPPAILRTPEMRLVTRVAVTNSMVSIALQSQKSPERRESFFVKSDKRE
jgi:hypothetical protein